MGEAQKKKEKKRKKGGGDSLISPDGQRIA